jgi:hypothetical protein
LRYTSLACFQLPVLEVEGVTGSNDAHAKRTQRELPALRHLVGVVESHRPTVDKCHAALSDHCSDLPLHDHRGVFIESKTYDLTIVGDGDEQPIKASPLGKMRIDQRSKAEQPESGADVLLDELAVIIHLIAGECQLGKSRRAGARSTHHSAARVVRPDRICHRSAAESADELHLAATAKKHATRILDHPDYSRIACIVARCNDGNLRVLKPSRAKVAPPPAGACRRIA